LLDPEVAYLLIATFIGQKPASGRIHRKKSQRLLADRTQRSEKRRNKREESFYRYRFRKSDDRAGPIEKHRLLAEKKAA